MTLKRVAIGIVTFGALLVVGGYSYLAYVREDGKNKDIWITGYSSPKNFRSQQWVPIKLHGSIKLKPNTPTYQPPLNMHLKDPRMWKKLTDLLRV